MTEQVPLAAIVPPLKDIEAAPALAVTVPPQFVVVFGVAATTIDPGEVGKVSLKDTPVRAVPEFGLVMVKVNVLTPPTAIGSGEKFFEMLGEARTDKVSLAVLPVPAFVEETLPLVLL